MKPEEQLIKQRKDKLEQLKRLGAEAYPYSFLCSHVSSEILAEFSKLKKDENSKKSVNIAGRIVTIREMGKASFGHLQDQEGKLQFYIREDEVGEKQYNIFKLLDIGDIIGINGKVFKTKTEEVTVRAKEIKLLCKGLRPLPEKWHGLKDMEVRYRQRYLDLISNPEVKKVFVIRSKIIQAIRGFLDQRGFLEVETPILQQVYGGANARPFKTFLHDRKMDVYLRISDELYLKRLIIGGFDKVYEIGKDFRNESIDTTHNPEFTMMECYWSYADYQDMMNLTKEMVMFVAKKVNGTTKIEFKGHKIDLAKWETMTMVEAIRRYTKIGVENMDDDEIKQVLRNYNIEYEGDFTRGLAIEMIFDELVEDKLVQPTFIIDHPKETTALCKLKRGNPAFIERFEPYVAGMEIGNAYSELNDPVLQKKFLEEQLSQRKKDETHPVDEDFIRAMEYGMPPTGGLGIGIDRWVMLLTGKASIRDVIFFPFMAD